MTTRNPTPGETAANENTAAASLALSELHRVAPLRPAFALVASLPEKPEGWTKRMVMHLNMGRRNGHSGVYQVIDAAGNETPIGYQYNTKDTRLCGFTLPGIDGPMTWGELRRAWPEWVAKTKAAAA